MHKINLSDNAVTTLKKRYFQKLPDGSMESAVELFDRVAKAVAAAEANYSKDAKVVEMWAEKYYHLLTSLDFLPNSPTLKYAGSTKAGCLSACLVLPVEDSRKSIFQTLSDAVECQARGLGTGYNFSALRPKGDEIISTGGRASGPISFMSIYDVTIGPVIAQGGFRKGAQMGILNCDHPQIEEFIGVKQKDGILSSFNLSVGITDKFMEAVKKNKTWDLVYQGIVHKTINARDLWDMILQSAWHNGEPGVIFLDRVNDGNALYDHCTINATNPCGEQPLPPYGVCNLGSINLAHMYSFRHKAVNWVKLEETVKMSVRFLDDVIDVNYYPLEAIKDVAHNTRLIGLGVMGWADLLLYLGIKYNSKEAIALAKEISKFINDKAREASEELAATRGAYTWWKEGNKINPKPIRNAARTTIAPTGTLSIIAGCSGGIEPNFAWSIDRSGQLDGSLSIDYHPLAADFLKDGKALPAYFVASHEVETDWHVKMQAAWQMHTDNAISKCIAKGTRIQTNKGLLRIEDIGSASKCGEFAGVNFDDLQVICPDGKWRKVVNHYYDGKKPTIKVRLSNGAEIEGSVVHQLMSVDGWKQLQDITEGDFIASTTTCIVPDSLGKVELPKIEYTYHYRGNYVTFTEPTHMSVDLASILGALCADGHLNDSNGLISLCEKNDAVGDRYKNLFSKVFGVTPVLRIDARTGVKNWNFNSIPLCLFIKSLIGYRSLDKHAPEQIMRGSVDEQLAFVSGVTLDGYKAHMSNRDWVVLYEGKSKQLAQDVFSICSSLKLSPRIGNKYVKSHDYFVYSVRVPYFDSCWEKHKDVRRKMTADFKMVNPVESLVKFPKECLDLPTARDYSHWSIVSHWKKQNPVVCKNTTLIDMGVFHNNNIEYLKVTSISYGVADLYDIEVEYSHDYLIDGIVSHNTINAPNSATIKDVEDAYMMAFDMGCKGITFYRDGSRDKQVLSTVKVKGGRKIGEKFELPDVMKAKRINMHTSKGKASLFIVLDDNKVPLEFYINPPVESPETAAVMTAICRLIAVGIQGFSDIDEFLDQLKKANKMYENKSSILTYITKTMRASKTKKNKGIEVLQDIPVEDEDEVIVKCIYNLMKLAQEGNSDINDYVAAMKITNQEYGNVSTVLAFLIKAFNKFTEVLAAEDGRVIVLKEVCPECKTKLILREGCNVCPQCSFSKCG